MKKILTYFLLASALPVIAAEPELKIFTDDEHTDTVFSPTYYVIAVTNPEAKGYVNGEEAHVYKTGSFGTALSLKPGLNKFSVESRMGKKNNKLESSIFYNPDKPKPNRSLAVTTPFTHPLNIVSKPYAYLQYGNGGDRLGGSKIGYIHEGINLTAVGETRNLYQVKLSQNRYAYIAKEDVEPTDVVAVPVNSSSWSISNTGKSDRIVISLPERLPFASWTEINPSQINVEIFGAMNNSNWITQRNKLEIIDFVDYDHSADNDVLTLNIRLKDSHCWGYSVKYEGTNLVIDVRHRPESLEIKDLTIGLDAGHGGEYPGAISPSGLKEKDVNLDIVLKAAGMLEKMGAKVVLTRDGDTGPSMTERKKTWLEGNVDIAISIHNNASGNPLVPMGTSCYYKHIANRELASTLHQSMLSLGLTNFGLTGNFNFALNQPTEYPNALVEVLFMSSLPEEELLASDEYRTTLARKVVDGLLNYLRNAKK